ncbi:S-adenosyl-L-methionine-dependent methyltransferase [Podospora appendiculata]|uniref:tRNA (uracil(54)-C(5))-methyltransferase n=1 Tax=Podospora appendiculata TaxID=314037 RepID=A0AAE0X3Q9_9PEZI|nr:S-adenosyl-L-methionine-dependent methyltransferase [Podospora appendiculata]
MAPTVPNQKRKRGRPAGASRNKEDASGETDKQTRSGPPQEALPNVSIAFGKAAASSSEPKKRGRPKKSVAEEEGEEQTSSAGKQVQQQAEAEAETADATENSKLQKKGRPGRTREREPEEDTAPAETRPRKRRKSSPAPDKTSEHNGSTNPAKGQKSSARGAQQPAPGTRDSSETTLRRSQRDRRSLGEPDRSSLGEIATSAAQNQRTQEPTGNQKKGKATSRQTTDLTKEAPLAKRGDAVSKVAAESSTAAAGRKRVSGRRSSDVPPQPAAVEPQPTSGRKKTKPEARKRKASSGGGGGGEADESINQDADPASGPAPKYRHLTARTRQIPRSTISAKWTALDEPSIAAVDSIISDAHLPVLSRLRGRDHRQEQAQAILHTFASRLHSKLVKGMPFPPPSVKAGTGRGAGATGGVGTHEAELDFERTVNATAALETALDPLLHSVALLKREKAEEEAALERDYRALRTLETNARAEARDWRERGKRDHVLASGVGGGGWERENRLEVVKTGDSHHLAGGAFNDIQEDAELVVLSQQLKNHMESMRGNLQQIEGVLPAIAKSKGALQGLLHKHLDPRQYDQVLLGAMPPEATHVQSVECSSSSYQRLGPPRPPMRTSFIRVFSQPLRCASSSPSSSSLVHAPSRRLAPLRLWNSSRTYSIMESTPPATAPAAEAQPVQQQQERQQNPQPEATPSAGKPQGKRPRGNHGTAGRIHAKLRKKQQKAAQTGSPEEVLLADIQALLAAHAISSEDVAAAAAAVAEEDKPAPVLPEQGAEIEVEVIELSSTGDGLARQKGSDQIYVVPFVVPGDTVKVKVYRHLPDQGHSVADFIAVTKPSPLRDDSRIKCQYFTKCSGCQFQMLEYSEQLKLKRDIVVKAYRNFSQLAPELVPAVLDTIGSPLQYNYRTKLTPHFDGPPGANRRGFKKPLDERPPIGFTPKTSRRVLDIEDCPIATDAVRQGLTAERARMASEFAKYNRGATILLRENTIRVPKVDGVAGPAPPIEGILPQPIKVDDAPTHTDYKTCITDNNATSTEYIDDFVFTNPAGAFFQNNNSILPPFTAYIRDHVLPPASIPLAKPIRNLIDAYSGSGLFTITQAALFAGGSVGIDIADKSIAFARRNAALNGLADDQCRFIAADAPELFKSVSAYDPDETVVVLDPPRKGCDASFLAQLLRFGPKRVVYVSCNVHTQARDVGVLVRGEVEGEVVEVAEGAETTRRVRYDIESIRGFDFFPQTGHVEGVAVLNRVEVV